MKQIDNKKEPNKIIERPRICCIDLKEEFVSTLKDSGANVYSGTLGSKIKVPNTVTNDNHHLLLNHNFPENLHEFDIIIIDLDYSAKSIDYKAEHYIKEEYTDIKAKYFFSSYPQTVFDPRPYSSSILRKQLDQITNRKYLIIVFASKSYNIVYQSVTISEGGRKERDRQEEHNIYSFNNNFPLHETKSGNETSVCNFHSNQELQMLLEKFRREITYSQTFEHPEKRELVYNENGYLPDINIIKDINYQPLIKNNNGDIISYININANRDLIVFPQIRDKGAFLLNFLSEVAPNLYPELFPYSITFSWKNEQEYWLPNHSTLLKMKFDIQQEYEEKILESENDIKENFSKFSFLHELLTETGDILVKSVIMFLKWLEFENVKDFDEVETNSSILEEDIQIELSEGLLIIECKGIGGTSKDSDCSQISKIKFRRCKERDSFNVFALYIVNHQKHLPPLKRQNPPFQDNQIKDAVNEERGLLTTWQLYNLYFDVTSGIITKEEARQSLLGYGLIEFKPKDLVKIYEPTEFFKSDTVCIVNVEDLSLSVNDELFVEHDGRFELVKILGIKENDISVQQALYGELGLELSSKVKKKSILWKRIS